MLSDQLLLLRDGDAVPLTGVSPDEIKQGAKQVRRNPDAPRLPHRRMLTAIVSRLGFRGDFGTYKNRGWNDFQALLRRHRCRRQTNLFPPDHFGPTRRQLAELIWFTSSPKRALLASGVAVDVIHATPRLVVLRAPDGTWDLLWDNSP